MRARAWPLQRAERGCAARLGPPSQCMSRPRGSPRRHSPQQRHGREPGLVLDLDDQIERNRRAPSAGSRRALCQIDPRRDAVHSTKATLSRPERRTGREARTGTPRQPGRRSEATGRARVPPTASREARARRVTCQVPGTRRAVQEASSSSRPRAYTALKGELTEAGKAEAFTSDALLLSASYGVAALGRLGPEPPRVLCGS